MTTVTIQVPDVLFKELNTLQQGFLVDVLERGIRNLKLERAINRYRQGGISIGAAANLAECSESEFARHAYSLGIEPYFSDDTLNEELS